MLTFDQWLDVIVRTSEPEVGFEIQSDVHASAALIYLWQQDEVTNARMIEALNFDGADPELTTVKTHLNGLSKEDTLALQSDMILSAINFSVTGLAWDKARLRTKFGL
jgi:hypothetical protein